MFDYCSSVYSAFDSFSSHAIANPNSNIIPIYISQVSIDCTFVGADGSIQTCLSEKDPYNKDGMVPHHWFPSNECGETYEATVTATLCNDNTASTDAITLFKNAEKPSYIKIKNQDIAFTETIIPPNDCVTVVKRMDQIKCKATVLSVQLQGFITSLGENSSFCYSFIHNKGKSKQIPEPVVISPACPRLY